MQAIAAFGGRTAPALINAPPLGEPRAGEVLCRTLELGVCGTDREILLSAQPLVPDGCGHLILGHECLARVEAVGAGVREPAVGDLVVPVVRRPLDTAGVNPAARARVDLWPFGTFVERGIVREHGFSAPFWIDRPEYLFPVADEISGVAVLAEPLAVSEKGVNEAIALQRGRLGAHTWAADPPRVLVTGMGPIGFTAVLAAIVRGWPVTMYGRDAPDSFRARLVQSLGARYLPATERALEPADAERDGYDLVLECTGSDEVMLAAARSLASCGVMVWLGSSRVPKPQSLNVQLLMRDGILRNHVHVGTVNAARRDFQHALAHLSELRRSHPGELAALITARVRPEDSLWHYEHRQPQGIKTVLMYS
jgi:threonine dehydrogenase-like Zn-dependent dehydrogenase